MLPMPITVEEYGYHFAPSPDYMIVERIKIDYENFRGILMPTSVKTGVNRFIGVGRIVAISEFPSEDEYTERLKDLLRKQPYVGFEFHVVAQCVQLPQFELPRDADLVCMHVKDAVYIPKDLDVLLARHAEYEKNELERREKELAEIKKCS